MTTTTLAWRPRVSRAKRAAALALAGRCFAAAEDSGTALTVQHADGDTGVCWFFMLGHKLFRDIKPAREGQELRP